MAALAVAACWIAGAVPAMGAVERHPLPDVDGLPSNLLFEPDGDLRFVYGGDGNDGSAISDQLGRLTPAGQLTLASPGFFGFGPSRTDLALDAGGGLWAAHLYANGLHRLAPDGTVERTSVGSDTTAFTEATTGPDGAVYTATHSEAVFRHSVADDGSIQTDAFDPAIAPAHGNSAYDLAFLGGRIYLMGNARCSNDDCVPARLVEIDPAAAPGEQRREISIPALDYGTNFEHIVAGPDGRLWVQDGARPRTIHRFTPAGADAPLTLPPGAHLRSLEPGPAGSVLAITDQGALARVRPDGKLTEWCPQDPALVERGIGHGYLIETATGPGGSVWFSARGEIGRVALATPALAGCAPEITGTSVEMQGTAEHPQPLLRADVARGGGRLPDVFTPADPEIPGHGVRFEIGTTTDYGRTIPASDAPYQAYPEDLEPGRTYHFRAVVTTRFGTATGPDTTFTMPPPPSLQITGDRVEGGFPAIEVTVDPHGLATRLEIEYGPTAARGERLFLQQVDAAGGPQNLTLRMTGGAYDLRSQPEFHYRLVATNERGATPSEARMIPTPVFTPPPPDDGGTPPPPPGGGTAPPPMSPPAPGPVVADPIVQGPVPEPVATDVEGPDLRIPASNRRLTASRTGVVRLAFGPASEDTSGVVTLKTAGKVRTGSGRRRVVALGTKAFQLLDGQTAGVRIRLGRANRALLRRAGRLRVQANVTVRDARGNATVETYVFTLRAPRR